MDLPVPSMAVREERAPKASYMLWGIDWSEWFPRSLTEDGISIHWSDIESVKGFIATHFDRIFEDDPQRERFLSEPFDAPKMRYYRMADVFEVKEGERTIGVMIGAPSDWSTYYVRTLAVLPEREGAQVTKRFLPFLFERLAEVGVRRFEAETSPSNFATLLLLSRLRFNVTGTIVSERWGALLRLTKFLDEKAEGVFLDQFCSGVRYQARRRVIEVSNNDQERSPR